jgi:hypothetical protein
MSESAACRLRPRTGEAIVPYELRKIGAGICRSLAGRVP